MHSMKRKERTLYSIHAEKAEQFPSISSVTFMLTIEFKKSVHLSLVHPFEFSESPWN